MNLAGKWLREVGIETGLAVTASPEKGYLILTAGR